MPSQITIAFSTSKLPQFLAFLAQQEHQEFTLVDQRPAQNQSELEHLHQTMLTIATDHDWRFFYLGMDWARFEQEGGREDA